MGRLVLRVVPSANLALESISIDYRNCVLGEASYETLDFESWAFCKLGIEVYINLIKGIVF